MALLVHMKAALLADLLVVLLVVGAWAARAEQRAGSTVTALDRAQSRGELNC